MATREQMRRAERVLAGVGPEHEVRLFHGMLRAEGVQVWSDLDEAQMEQVLGQLEATPDCDRAAWIDGFCMADEAEEGAVLKEASS